MAKLSTVKRFFKEDFNPSEQAWIDKLLIPLNGFMSDVVFAVNKNLNITDNFLGELKILTIPGASVITGNLTAGSADITNAQFYRYVPANPNETIGPRINMPIVGFGVPVGASIQGFGPGDHPTTITMSQPAVATVTGAKIMAGGSFPFSFQHSLRSRPNVLLIGAIDDTSASPELLTEGISTQWAVDGQTVTLRNITGLKAGKNYRVVVYLQV